MLHAKRTLVKSGPELWAELSDPEALGSHFSAFGPIRITRTADASLVEWEGERATGRLELAPSGFGTKVVLEAEVASEEIPAPPPADPEPEPRRGFFARLFRRVPEPVAPELAPPVQVALMDEDEALEVLTATLDHLGTAHHRPFTR
jgi:hypothetical protein